jgi:putative FmdB family regulatory protein
MEDCGLDRQSFEDAMPLYEYRCKVCGELEEKIQSYSAPTEHDCPKCGTQVGMTRQLSKVAFNMSGGGWYAQGYSGKGAPAEGKEAPAAAKESSTPAKDSTPAAPGGCCSGCACKPGA